MSLSSFLGPFLSYVAIRSDEDRIGYISSKPNIMPRYPFITDDITRQDVIQILEDCGLGLPAYYKWRSRSGCYFCFFQRRDEYVGLYHQHPDLFERACRYETNHSDGRIYTWCEGLSLEDLVAKRQTANIDGAMKKKKKILKKNTSLLSNLAALNLDVTTAALREINRNNQESAPEHNDKVEPCLICTL
jgi:hypothetical protein